MAWILYKSIDKFAEKAERDGGGMIVGGNFRARLAGRIYAELGRAAMMLGVPEVRALSEARGATMVVPQDIHKSVLTAFEGCKEWDGEGVECWKGASEHWCHEGRGREAEGEAREVRGR